MGRVLNRLATLAAAAAVSACTLAPAYQRPALPIPPSWR